MASRNPDHKDTKLLRMDPNFLTNTHLPRSTTRRDSKVEASACRCETGRTGVPPGLLSAWGWCPPVLLVQTYLRQDLFKKRKKKKRLWA